MKKIYFVNLVYKKGKKMKKNIVIGILITLLVAETVAVYMWFNNLANGIHEAFGFR